MGVSGYTLWVRRESKKWKWRTLTHPVKLVAFHNLIIAEILRDTEELSQIEPLEKNFGCQ